MSYFSNKTQNHFLYIFFRINNLFSTINFILINSETAESMDIGSFKNPFCAWSYPDTLPADGSPRLSLSSSSGSGRLVSNSINKKLDYSKGLI